MRFRIFNDVGSMMEKQKYVAILLSRSGDEVWEEWLILMHAACLASKPGMCCKTVHTASAFVDLNAMAWVAPAREAVA